MEKNDSPKHLKRSSLISFISLSFQGGYSALLGLAANLVLTILLTPQIFGIYFTTLSIIALLNYFSDIGLAASLIQKKDITDEDITTTFTVQQILIVTLISLGFIVSPFIRSFYKLPEQGIYLLWALLISFFLSSLKTIPSIFLERQIKFQKIVLVQVVENTVFYSAVIVFALMKNGLMSFTYAVILRAIVGVILIYRISFWMPRIGISKSSLKKLLSFGIPYQASSFLALFKDDLITLFLGKVVGFEALGYIGWAKKWAEAPIRIIMDNLSRVLFPYISRIQDDKEKISRIIDKILYFQTLLLAPTLITLALLMHQVVFLIPKYAKWAPALPLFYMFCISAFFSSYSTPFLNVFNALGKAKISFLFMAFWTITTWICTPLFTHLYGMYGFPITQLILSSTFIGVMFVAKKQTPFHFLSSTYRFLLSALGLGSTILLMQQALGISVFSFITSAISGSFIYLLLLFLVFKINVVSEIKSFINE